MTRDQMMQEIIPGWAPPQPIPRYSPFYDDEDWSEISLAHDLAEEDKVIAWIASAPENWFDVLLDLAVNPPDIEQYRLELMEAWDYAVFDLDTWLYQIATALRLWAEYSPTFVLRKFYPLLANDKTRSFILNIMHQITHKIQPPDLKELLPRLTLLVNQVPVLKNEELKPLISTIATIKGHETNLLLKKIEDLIPPEQVDIHNHLTSYWNYRRKVFSEQ